MNPFLIAGLLGAGAGFLSRDKKKSRKKMAHGGQVPDHLIDVLYSQTTLTKSALQKFVKDNHFSKDDVLSIVSGIGRGQIEPMDVEMAVFEGIGSSENEELVEFAKSGKAFDLARGGEIRYEGEGLAEFSGERFGEVQLSKEAMKKAKVTYYPVIDLVEFRIGSSRVHASVDEDMNRAKDYRNFKEYLTGHYIVVNGKRRYLIDMKNDGEIDEIFEGNPFDKGVKLAKGGTTSDALERAFAEYMEDYGVDREEAEEQFLGEFDNKGEWAGEFVDDMGGMESLIDPERFYRIDKVGFREWAINMADSMVMDIDEDNVEEYAERHNLEDEFEIAEAKEERYPNKTDGYGHMDRFVEKVKEEEHESIVYVFEAENRDAQEVIANIGSDYGMSLDDLERAYLIIPDYDEVADALEDDGYVFIEEDFKTFVFNPNMARGGRTKRMKKGGKVKGLDKYGSWYYMDDDGTLFVRAQEMGQDKAPKWDEDDDEWGVVDSRAFGTMERQEFDRDMKKLFGRKPKLG